VTLIVVASATLPNDAATAGTPARNGIDAGSRDSLTAQILRGRALVLDHACSGCHSGRQGPRDPSARGYLAGSTGPEGEFRRGPMRVRPRNLTPDPETGIGRFTDRQIFNALRFGLLPSETPDVEITSTTPGEGQFPVTPRFLGPPMPWPAWRHMSDQQLWDIVAYLKHGVKPVRNLVPESDRPARFWAGYYARRIGPHPAATFPTVNEVASAAADSQVRRGRALVIHHDCGGCHGGGDDPAREGWLAGAPTPADTFQFDSFITRPRNLTPDNTTGLGRFSERQIFNALRFGLRPGETPDVEITSMSPGVGNFPLRPKYLAPPMPWPAWRHMTDQELRDIAAYLKRGVKPVSNRVIDSEGPPDFWVNLYTVERIGPYPASPFPTSNEVARP
jgi:mono/diheme cytochrome c family protein